MWQLYAGSSLIAVVASIFLGILVYARNPASILNRRFAVVSILIGVWCLFPLTTAVIRDPQERLFLGRLSYLAAFFTPSAFFHFVFVMLDIYRKRRGIRFAIAASYIISILFLSISFSPFFIRDTAGRMPNSYVVPGPGYLLFILFFISFCPYAIYQIYAFYKNSTGYRKEQGKFLFAGFLIALVGGGMHLFAPYADVEPFPHDLLLVIWNLIISYAIIRFRFLDIRIAVTQVGIFLAVYTLILGIPFWFGYSTGLWVWAVALMGVFASIGPFAFQLLQKKAESILLSEQRRYQKLLLQAASGMAREHDLDKLLKVIVYVVTKAVKTEFAAIFIEEKETQCYRLKAIRDHHKVPKTLEFPHDHPLVRRIKQSQEPLSHEEIEPYLDGFMDKPVHLIIPSFTEDELTGLLFLGEKKNRALFTGDDINVFKILSHQAALAITNCLFIEEFKKTQEKLFAAEKLAAVGGMADGVAHQIRNRLNQFSVAAGEQTLEIEYFIGNHAELIAEHPDLKQSLDYLNTTAQSVVTNVKKTAGVIQGILNFARVEEKETQYSEFPLSEILPSILELLCVKHQLAVFPLEVEPGPDTVYGIKSQIIECVYNLFDNGYEAGKDRLHVQGVDPVQRGYVPGVRMRVVQKESSTLIVIADNGVGIKDEHKRKIFAPFFTTKPSVQSGTGIGLYVVKRMVEENHHGRIWFESEYLKGTTIYLELPGKTGGRQSLVAN